MKSAYRPPFLPILLAVLILHVPSTLVFAQSEAPSNDPLDFNPIARSWKFTQPGDYVSYSVLGTEDRDQEVWAFVGRKGDTCYYVVQKRLDGDDVGERETRSYPYNEDAIKQSIARTFISQGYKAQRQNFVNEGRSIPAVQVSNETEGTFAYSEDVPLGGLVKQVDNATGITYQLAKFKRQQEPPPSTVPLERSADEGKSTGTIGAVTLRPDGKKTAIAAPVVKSLDTIIREDADTTPIYFKPTQGATRSSKLDDIGWITSLRILIPQSIAKWKVSHFKNLEENSETPDLTYELRFQTESISEEGIVKITRDASKLKGQKPEGFDGTAKGYLIDPATMPLFPREIQAVYLERTGVEFYVEGYKYETNQYLVFETPLVMRKPLEGAEGEVQDIKRVVHRLWVDQPPGSKPLLVKRETTTYNYYHEGIATKPEKVERSETRHVEMLSYLLSDLSVDSLSQYAAPVADGATPASYDELKKDPVMALP